MSILMMGPYLHLTVQNGASGAYWGIIVQENQTVLIRTQEESRKYCTYSVTCSLQKQTSNDKNGGFKLGIPFHDQFCCVLVLW